MGSSVAAGLRIGLLVCWLAFVHVSDMLPAVAPVVQDSRLMYDLLGGWAAFVCVDVLFLV
jgi:hypothetical protein